MQAGLGLGVASGLRGPTPRAERTNRNVHYRLCIRLGHASTTLAVGALLSDISTRAVLRLRTIGSLCLLLGGAMTRQERERNKGEFEG